MEMARQTPPEQRINKFLCKLEDEGGLDSGTTAH
jgi:hypothetical protein